MLIVGKNVKDKHCSRESICLYTAACNNIEITKLVSLFLTHRGECTNVSLKGFEIVNEGKK